MSRLLVVIELLIGLAVRFVDGWNQRKRREAEDDLQGDVEDIKSDPVDYAQREYGGVPGDAEEKLPVPSDSPDGADDRTG